MGFGSFLGGVNKGYLAHEEKLLEEEKLAYQKEQDKISNSLRERALGQEDARLALARDQFDYDSAYKSMKEIFGIVKELDTGMKDSGVPRAERIKKLWPILEGAKPVWGKITGNPGLLTPENINWAIDADEEAQRAGMLEGRKQIAQIAEAQRAGREANLNQKQIDAAGDVGGAKPGWAEVLENRIGGDSRTHPNPASETVPVLPPKEGTSSKKPEAQQSQMTAPPGAPLNASVVAGPGIHGEFNDRASAMAAWTKAVGEGKSPIIFFKENGKIIQLGG